MLKIFSIAAVFSGCAALGVMSSKRLGNRMKTLEGIRSFIRRLEIEMRYAGLPVAEAMRSAGEKTAGAARELFEGVADDLQNNSGEAIGGIFGKRLESIRKNRDIYGALTDRDAQMLVDFSKNLGSSDWASQKNNFEHTQKLLEEEITAAKEAFGKKSKMFRTLGVLGGLLLAVLLL